MLPEKFKERMKNILGDEYPEFEAALERPSVRGVRVNTTKISPSDYLEISDFKLTPISYREDCFIPEECEGIGRTAEHHSGMIYVQDPGAMATLAAIDVKKGWRVLDTCAAPGGKASHLASLVGDEGLLLANEYVSKRAKIIVGNLERMGVRNAVVTSLDTAKLKDMFSSYFDLVLCDAPCSGEGMFRKYDDALTEWSEENVTLCAKRQSEILDNCAGSVKSGGYLLYSTCTYSTEENEEVISDFLRRHGEFSLCEVRPEVRAVTADGLMGLNDARRFYHHLSDGEGQFLALMKKEENPNDLPTILYKENIKTPTKDEMAVINKFIKDNFISELDARIIKSTEQIILLFHDLPLPTGSVFMSGVVMGEIKKGILFPHHQLFSACGHMMKRRENLKRGDERVSKYLRGEEIDTGITESGWCAVTYEGACMGGGKISGGKIKNHYPKGLRNNK